MAFHIRPLERTLKSAHSAANRSDVTGCFRAKTKLTSLPDRNDLADCR